jgi:hypothetical protein
MDVVRMVLTGQVGRELVGLVNQHGPLAVGLSGEDAGLFGARRRKTVEIDGAPVDIGLVGDVETVDPTAVLDILEAGRIPVVSTIAPDLDVRRSGPQCQRRHRGGRARGRSRCAQARRPHRRRGGVCRVARPGQPPLPVVGQSGATRSPAHAVDEGMIPKLEACIRAVEDGVPQAHVVDGRKPHSLLLEVFTKRGHRHHDRGRTVAAEPTRSSTTDRPLRLLDRYAHAVLGVFGTPRWCSTAARAATSGTSTASATSTCSAGIAVNALGHNHPELVVAVSKQAGEVVHVSNFFTTRAQIELAERLLRLAQAPPTGRRSSSPTAAPSRSRRRSNWRAAPAGPGSSRSRAPSTAAAPERSR